MSQELMRQFGETVTQLIAFVIFFWLMKKYAWGPVRELLEARRLKIEEGFADIDRKRAEAEKLHRDYAEHLRNIDQEGRAKIQEAVSDGRRIAEEIKENARAESQRMIEQALRNLELENAKARVELRDQIVSMTLLAGEKLLRRSVDTETDRRLVSDFLADLEKEMPQTRG